MDENVIRQFWNLWKVDSFLDMPTFVRLAEETCEQLISNAKRNEMINYGQLDAYKVLESMFGDGVSKVIGFVVGVCSECEIFLGHPPISAIVVKGG